MYSTLKNVSNKKPTINANAVCNRYFLYPDETGKRKIEGGLRLEGRYKQSLQDKPLITVITVVYNNEATLERCIKSVLEQTYDNLEYIVIDGGSNDGTLDIIKKYQDSIDYFISEPDNGIYQAMNKGISLASGNYICLLNSDDYYAAEFIFESVKKALEENTDIVYSNYYMFGKETCSSMINEGIYIHYLNINHSTFLVSKNAYNKIGPYREDYKIVSDAVWMRLAYQNGITFLHLNKSLFYFTEGGLSSGNSEKRRRLFISEVGHSYREVFDFLTQDDAEELYLSRFNLERIDSLLKLYNRYAHKKSLFKNSLKKYLEFMLKNKFIFNDKNTLNHLGKYLDLCDKLEIPYSNLNISDINVNNAFTSIDNILKNSKNKSNKIILHFVSNFSTPSETFIYDLITYFEKNTEYNNYVLCDTRELAIERPYCKVIHVPWNDLSEELGLNLYKYLFDSLKLDIVICHFMLNGWKLYERLNKIDLDFPTIHMTHGIDVFSMNTTPEYKDFVFNFINPNPQHKITTVSNYLKNNLLELGVTENKITLIHNVANERFFQYRKQKFHKENNTLKIINFGRLINWKGHKYLLEGLKYFIDNVSKNVDLTIVHANSSTTQEVKEQIEKLEIQEFVTLVPFVDFNQTPDFLTKFDIAINSSIYSQDKLQRSETFGMFTLESILSGLLVIGTDAGGTPEVIGDNNKFAKIVPHANSKAIGKAIEEFYNCRECFSDNNEYARDRLARFSREKQMTLFDNLLDEVSKKINSVALFSTNIHGGAGYAAFRLHKALLKSNISSQIFVKQTSKLFYGVRNLDYVLKYSPLRSQIKNIFVPNRTMFSLNEFTGTHIDLLACVQDFDIVNIHWVADSFLSVENIAFLSHLNKPLIITVRDMNPLTGGCHYFHECEKWKTDCMNCPQLIDHYNDYPAKILAAKKKYFNFENITVVALSNHSKRIIEKSIYKNCRIEVIPNSIEIDIFVPTDKSTAKKEFKLPKDKKVIFFLPSYNSTIKGMSELNQALDLLKDKKDEYHLLVAGSGSMDFQNENFQITQLGHINNNEKLALAYSAADITIVPSLEETFSNTTAESISCGTPVVGFKIAGLPDMIKDSYNGYTVELGDIKGLADSINKVLNGKNMSSNCREYAEKNLKLDIQAKRYNELFEDLLAKPVEKNKQSEFIPEVFSETAPTIIKLLNESVSTKDTELKQKDIELKQKDTELIQKDIELKQKDIELKQKDIELKQKDIELKQKDIELKQKVDKLKQAHSKIKKVTDNKWYRFGLMSNKRKIWKIGKVVSKKIGIYTLLRPFAQIVKKLIVRENS